jgi:hypothetical protein
MIRSQLRPDRRRFALTQDHRNAPDSMYGWAVISFVEVTFGDSVTATGAARRTGKGGYGLSGYL